MFLTIDHLIKRFGQRTILQGLDFDVHPGEILVVLGPSGCGKSTLLSCINGFTPVTAGQVILEGADITKQPPEERDITTVFQSYSLFPHMTVRQNLMFGLKFRRLPKQKKRQQTTDMLDLLQLGGYADAKIQDLSGGQQQRVALGRSLIVAPRLLLLDEPFSNLDEKLRLAMRSELRRIQKELGMTMIFVTHDQQEAFALGDRILLMNQGSIQQLSDGPTLYDNPANAFVLKFIGVANLLGAAQYVRPEAIELTGDDQGAGKIVHRLFQGATVNYQVAYQGQTFEVTCLNQSPVFQVGQRVQLAYRPKLLEAKS